MAIALIREYTDDRIGSEEDLERALPDDPVLGLIPEIDDLVGAGAGVGPGLTGRGDAIGAEAYRSLAASVEFARIGKPVTVIHVTSALPGDGKSTTAANLAKAFAESGTRVVVVDADLRRPSLHRLFDVDVDKGLSTYLTRPATALEDVLQTVGAPPNLKLLSPGSIPENPTRVLYARRTEELFDRLRAEFDVVIIDSPPVLPVADALILTQFADLVLLVARADHTGRRILRKARKAIGRVEAGHLATVLNRLRRQGPDGYDHYYGRYYLRETAIAEDLRLKSRLARSVRRRE